MLSELLILHLIKKVYQNKDKKRETKIMDGQVDNVCYRADIQ